VDLFVERVAEYKATVKRIEESELQQVMDASFVAQQVENLVVPPGFPDDWLPDTIHPRYDNSSTPLSHDELDQSDGVVTTCSLAVAQTGTIILDAGAGQGRRALTLLPDYHLCIVRADQIVELVPEGFAHFEESIKNEGPPITFISGPSATSDIELSRVEGVHGPRRLEVLVLND
jgi:L-lactate dehydrogenase complex protein LldG